MVVAVAVAVAVSGAVAVAVVVAGLTKRFFNHIQKDFLINVWGYWSTRNMAISELKTIVWVMKFQDLKFKYPGILIVVRQFN